METNVLNDDAIRVLLLKVQKQTNSLIKLIEEEEQEKTGVNNARKDKTTVEVVPKVEQTTQTESKGKTMAPSNNSNNFVTLLLLSRFLKRSNGSNKSLLKMLPFFFMKNGNNNLVTYYMLSKLFRKKR